VFLNVLLDSHFAVVHNQINTEVVISGCRGLWGGTESSSMLEWSRHLELDQDYTIVRSIMFLL